MNPTVQVAKFSGNPTSSWWGQIHDFTPSDADKFAKRGRLIAVFSWSVNSLDQLEMIKVGREILTRLHEEYFGDTGLDAFSALNAAIKQIHSEFSSEDTPLQVGALVLIGEKIIFSGQGIVGFVLRSGNLAKILSETTTHGAGIIQEGDTFLLGNQELFYGAPEGNIKASLERSQAQEVLESLTPFIYENKKDKAVGVVVKFTKQAFFAATSQINQFQDEPPVYSPTPIGGFKGRLVSLLDNLIAKIPQRKIKITSEFGDLEERNKKRKVIVIGGILLLLLVLSILFGIRQRNQKVAVSKYEDRLISAQHQLEEAKTLTTLNAPRAKELLFSARDMAQTLQSEGVKDPRLDQLLSDIATNIGGIAGIYEVNPEMYLDLSLISSGFKADDVSFSEDRMLVLDKAGKLVSIVLSTKKTRVIAGPEKLTNPQFTAAYADRNFVLTDEAVLEVAGNTSEAIKKDWEQPAGIHAFAANIYLMDKGNNVIWRYAGSESGFGSQKNWFAPGIEVNLSGVVAWSIDGSIWLLTQSGEIEKYANGNPQSFRLEGVDANFSGAVDIFSNDTTSFLYILDPNRGRVIVLDKDGGYKAEYVSEKIKESGRLIVSEEEKKIILVNQDKLYSIDAKHL